MAFRENAGKMVIYYGRVQAMVNKPPKVKLLFGVSR